MQIREFSTCMSTYVSILLTDHRLGCPLIVLDLDFKKSEPRVSWLVQPHLLSLLVLFSYVLVLQATSLQPLLPAD